MQDEIEIVLVSIYFLPLNVIQDVFLHQRVERKNIADRGQVGGVVRPVNIGPAGREVSWLATEAAGVGNCASNKPYSSKSMTEKLGALVLISPMCTSEPGGNPALRERSFFGLLIGE